MPHLKLEYSSNLKERIDPARLFAPCHRILVDTVNAELFRCQSRVIRHEVFYVGEGSPSEAFIFLEIFLGTGRSLSLLQEAGEKILRVLEGYFSQSLKELDIQIAVCFVEFSVPLYFKIESRI